MTRLALLVLLLAAPTAAGLGVLPPQPEHPEAPGLSSVEYRIPVRTDAEALEASSPGDPVGSVGLAAPGASPETWHPLQARHELPVPPTDDRCWRGYCDVHHVVVRLVAPNHDGIASVPLDLAAGASRIRVPLQVEATPREPAARIHPQVVAIEAPASRHLDGARLQGPDGSWAARSGPAGFAVPRDRLPPGTPLEPVLTLANGTEVHGTPVTLPTSGPPEEPSEDPPTQREQAEEPPADAGNRSDATQATSPDPATDPDEPSTAPVRSDADDRALPAEPLAALATLAVASRAARAIL